MSLHAELPRRLFQPLRNDLRSLVVEGLSAELANHNQRAVVAEYRARRSCSCKLAVFLRFDVVRRQTHSMSEIGRASCRERV